MSRNRNPKRFGLLLAIAKSGKTERALSAQAGIHYSSLSRILNSHTTPKPPTVDRLCRALGVNPKALGFDQEGGVA